MKRLSVNESKFSSIFEYRIRKTIFVITINQMKAILNIIASQTGDVSYNALSLAANYLKFLNSSNTRNQHIRPNLNQAIDSLTIEIVFISELLKFHLFIFSGYSHFNKYNSKFINSKSEFIFSRSLSNIVDRSLTRKLSNIDDFWGFNWNDFKVTIPFSTK